MIQYRFTGQYREYNGYVFANGRPVTITDNATLNALQRMPEFEIVKGGDPVGEEKRQGPLLNAMAQVREQISEPAPRKRMGWPKGKKRK